MIELKNCPFCGGPVELERTVDRREWWGVVCRNTINIGGTCAIQQRPSASKEAAVERWNIRATPAEPPRGKVEDDLANRVWSAVLDCPHEIESGSVTLRYYPADQNGGNALAQLHSRIETALKEPGK